MALKDHIKETIADKEFDDDENNQNYSRKIFRNVFSVNKTFKNVDFSQSSFSNCYFRKCTFIDCNFTGSSFKDSYLIGSKFPDSIFKYTTFSNSNIDDKFLDLYLPPEENLARDLVRNLRVNFSETGEL